MDQDPVVFIVDDDAGVCEGLSLLFESVAIESQSYCSAMDFLESYDKDRVGCLILDIRMPFMTGLDLQKKLHEQGSSLPIIFITGHGDIPMAVEAMRNGALDFIRKPFREQDLLDRVNEALTSDISAHNEVRDSKKILRKVESLTEREREVFESVAQGNMNKVTAAELGISERTVEVHRARVMKKLDVRTLAQLVRIKIECEIQSEAD